MSIDKIYNHYEQAISRLLQQYKNKPNIASILKIYCQQIQELETIFFQLINSIQLINAINLTTEGGDLLLTEDDFEIVFTEGEQVTGDLMDRIGALIECSRNDLSDGDYFTKIINKIEVNIANGRVPQVINIFKRITNSDKVRIYFTYPASFVINSDENTWLLSNSEVKTIFDIIVAAGVGYTIIKPKDPPFVFLGGDGEGFRDLDVPGSGGYLAEII